MRSLAALLVGEKQCLGVTKFKKVVRAGRKNIIKSYNNVCTILQEPLRSELLQIATYGLRGSSQHKQWRPSRIVEPKINRHVNKGLEYLDDITFKSVHIEIIQIKTVSYADVDTSCKEISSYLFHNVSYNCAIQVIISSSDVDVRVVTLANDLQSSMSDSTKVVYFAVGGFVKHRNHKNTWAVCFRLTPVKIGKVLSKQTNETNKICNWSLSRIVQEEKLWPISVTVTAGLTRKKFGRVLRLYFKQQL